MILARLAVDRTEQRDGLGSASEGFVTEAPQGPLTSQESKRLLVHGKDEEARRWYERLDFDPSPSDPMHLFLVMKDIRRLIRP